MTEDLPIRDRLRSAITQAMRARDRDTLAVFRSALAAIDNAEAVPLRPEHRAGAIEESAAGLGRAEAPRRVLSEAEMVELVRSEAAERRAAADPSIAADAAERLLREADLLDAFVASGRAG